MSDLTQSVAKALYGAQRMHPVALGAETLDEAWQIENQFVRNQYTELARVAVDLIWKEAVEQCAYRAWRAAENDLYVRETKTAKRIAAAVRELSSGPRRKHGVTGELIKEKSCS